MSQINSKNTECMQWFAFLFCFIPVGMAVYNVVIACAVGTPVVTFVQDKQFEASFVVPAICILFSTTSTLCIVFVPKVRV